jgi:hypothetical protein
MLYLIPAATALMLAYVAWMAIFRLRRERVLSERKRTRGKFAFRPKERLRLLLGRAYHVGEERPEWEDELVSRLAAVPVKGSNDGPTAPRP